MLPLGTSAALVDVEPSVVLLVPLGYPARGDRGGGHGRLSGGRRCSASGLVGAGLAVSRVGVLGVGSLRGIVVAAGVFSQGVVAASAYWEETVSVKGHVRAEITNAKSGLETSPCYYFRPPKVPIKESREYFILNTGNDRGKRKLGD